MADGAVLDTSFLINLVDSNRPCHATACAYYRFFLENGMPMFLPTVVAAEFAVKQSITDLPLRNFIVLPFNLEDATCCAALRWALCRQTSGGTGNRDAVKDDFKIIAHTVGQNARCLVTEDEETMGKYCDLLKQSGRVIFRLVPLLAGFDEARVNQDGQSTLRFGDAPPQTGQRPPQSA